MLKFLLFFAHRSRRDTDKNVSHPYLQLTKVFDHPLNDKALMTYNNLSSQAYTYNELLFFPAQSIAFISKKQYKHPSENYAQAVSGFESPIENIPEKFDDFKKISENSKTN